jgi:hypothetical protein
MTPEPVTYEYALVPVSATHAARLPLPFGQTAAQRAAYLANPPKDVLDAAERWPLPPDPTPEPPAPTTATQPRGGKE